jgi:thiol-disulfide isomerase/thioredoxin
MEVLENTIIKDIISESLENSMSYGDYRTLVSDLTAENSTTGAEKTKALANYTMLNDRRMKRWDKTIKISETAQEKIKAFNGKMTWLVLTESWCGDAAHIMPVINKVAELNTNITYKIVLRDDNDALMNAFLTNGGKSIPKLIMVDNNTDEVANTFGPRPSKATKMVNDYKEEHGELTPAFKEGLQLWYNKDKGQAIIENLVAALEQK